MITKFDDNGPCTKVFLGQIVLGSKCSYLAVFQSILK